MPRPTKLAGVFLLVFALTATSTKARAVAVGAKSDFVTTTDGVRIHYLEAAPRAGKARNLTILFVPGWTMPAEIWEPQIVQFADNYRVVAMDPRSQGLSSQTTEGHYPDARARDIKAVVDQLHLAPVVLVGWSLGVRELVAYVDQFGNEGIAGLVMVEGSAGAETGPAMIAWELQIQKDRRAATADFVRSMYQKPQSEAYLNRIIQASLRTPTNTAMALLLSSNAEDRRPALAKIKKPTLIVAANGRNLQMYEDMHQRIAGSQFRVFDGVGHALFVDAAEEFNALLGAFLKGLQ